MVKRKNGYICKTNFIYVSMKKWLFLLALVFSVSVGAAEYKLWYDTPAQVWTEALPLGNGRLGAMVYGNPEVEQIQLNEETIWAGGPNNNANPDAKTWIPRIREAVNAGRYREAQDLAGTYVKSRTNQGMPYQSFGDLRIGFAGHGRYEDYYRELSLDSARVVVRYKVDGVTYTRETFTSFVDQVVVTHISADRPGHISFNAMFTSPQPDVVIASEGDAITLNGAGMKHEGLNGVIKFQGRATVRHNGGHLLSRDGVLSVENADEATIYVSIATNFNNYRDVSGDCAARANEYLAAALQKRLPR